MTKGVFFLEEILKLQQKIVPELIELLEKRYNILRTIYYNQPIGRRILANQLDLGERVVRTEINFLKSQNLIDINTPGMTVTEEGEEIIDKLKSFIHEIKGLSEIESIIKTTLGLKNVIIVPGDMDEDKTVIKEIGRAAANFLKVTLKSGHTIALTGGSTIKEVIDNFPKMNNIEDVLVVPARGGMGRNVETQANTLAANLSKKTNGSYKMLHVPDNISDRILDSILNERDIKDVLDSIKNADVLIYGIGKAEEMAVKRGMDPEKVENIVDKGAVGEAFGCYFDKKGSLVCSTSSVGVTLSDTKRIPIRIAVAGGASKADAIISTEFGNDNSTLITDEGAARGLMEIIKKEL